MQPELLSPMLDPVSDSEPVPDSVLALVLVPDLALGLGVWLYPLSMLHYHYLHFLRCLKQHTYTQNHCNLGLQQ